jgi:hypothetical protein
MSSAPPFPSTEQLKNEELETNIVTLSVSFELNAKAPPEKSVPELSCRKEHDFIVIIFPYSWPPKNAKTPPLCTDEQLTKTLSSILTFINVSIRKKPPSLKAEKFKHLQ